MSNSNLQTNMERTFYEIHVPKVIRSLEEIAYELKRSNHLKEKELEIKEHELKLKHRELIDKNQ